MNNPFDPRLLATAILAVQAWLTPQPALTHGLLVLYGGPRIVSDNAGWHHYDMADVPCGAASMDPHRLGQLAWYSIDRRHWVGPCRIVDVLAREDALRQLEEIHEVGEPDSWVAERLHFDHGAPGYVWYGACPPAPDEPVQPYRVPLVLDWPPYDATPSMWPYPPAQPRERCLTFVKGYW